VGNIKRSTKTVIKHDNILTSNSIGYDSSGKFDDSCPQYFGEETTFYSTLGPVFERWARWSKVEMPKLGDDNSVRYSFCTNHVEIFTC
jgi:hypothetical protein